MLLFVGTNLYQVAAHEFGHALGLSHSNVRTSLMAPFYRGYDDNLHLDQDDISAIQDIYGAPRRAVSGWNGFSSSSQSATSRNPFLRRNNPRKPVTSDTTPDSSASSSAAVCKSPIIDAITVTHDGNTYAFKDDMYYQLNEEGVEPGFPRKIATDWAGLPGYLDAALTWNDGKTFFFKVTGTSLSFFVKVNLNLATDFVKKMKFFNSRQTVRNRMVWKINQSIDCPKNQPNWRPSGQWAHATTRIA